MATKYYEKKQREAFKRQTSQKYVKTRWDFAEIFTAKICSQNKSEFYCSNQSVSIEGINVDHIFEKLFQ